MTVTDTFLENTAAALNSETYLVPQYLLASSTTTSIGSTDTSFAGEVGDRYELTNSRSGNQVTYNALRPAADITSTAGEDIRAVGTITQETGGLLMTGITVSGITQTTSFDLEIDTVIEVARK